MSECWLCLDSRQTVPADWFRRTDGSFTCPRCAKLLRDSEMLDAIRKALSLPEGTTGEELLAAVGAYVSGMQQIAEMMNHATAPIQDVVYRVGHYKMAATEIAQSDAALKTAQDKLEAAVASLHDAQRFIHANLRLPSTVDFVHHMECTRLRVALAAIDAPAPVEVPLEQVPGPVEARLPGCICGNPSTPNDECPRHGRPFEPFGASHVGQPSERERAIERVVEASTGLLFLVNEDYSPEQEELRAALAALRATEPHGTI